MISIGHGVKNTASDFFLSEKITKREICHNVISTNVDVNMHKNRQYMLNQIVLYDKSCGQIDDVHKLVLIFWAYGL